jgi:hypothetical protein
MGPSLEEAQNTLCGVPADLDELAALFDRNRCTYDVPPGRIWPETGYSIGAWNGSEEPLGVSLVVLPGSDDNVNPRCNYLSLTLSDQRLATGRPWEGPGLRDLTRLLIEAWEPDEGWVSSRRYDTMVPYDEKRKYLLPWVGWVTLLTPAQLLKVTPPAGVHVEALPQGGALCTLCEEPFTVDNPRHMALAHAMAAAMRPIQAYSGE